MVACPLESSIAPARQRELEQWQIPAAQALVAAIPFPQTAVASKLLILT